jgi:hypothetical protein
MTPAPRKAELCRFIPFPAGRIIGPATFLLVVVLTMGIPAPALFAQEPPGEKADDRIHSLETTIDHLSDQLRELKNEVDTLREDAAAREEAARRESAAAGQATASISAVPLPAADDSAWYNRFTVGGYGEMHANFGEGDTEEKFDIHRLVLYLGYDFNDWIRFQSETEIEHAFVSDDSGGELVLEQAFVDFLLSDPFNVRVGRVLTPLGIINQKHEPPSFYGVERPSFARVIIPTTWSSDGAGIFGSVTSSLKYQAYVVGGLDGSGFDDVDGIRGGRIKERPSLNEPAVTGRVDYFPFVDFPAGPGQTLRLGASAYAGGFDNGNNGEDPGIDGDITIFSGDFEYTVSRFDFRGVIAWEDIDGAEEIGNGTASEIFGWYLEGAYHFWPDSWKTGKLAKSDAAVFVRYDDYDTQYDTPSGVEPNPAGDRSEWTFGVNFYPVPNFVIKADYQVRDDETSDGLDDLWNLGVGWQF